MLNKHIYVRNSQLNALRVALREKNNRIFLPFALGSSYNSDTIRTLRSYCDQTKFLMGFLFAASFLTSHIYYVNKDTGQILPLSEI